MKIGSRQQAAGSRKNLKLIAHALCALLFALCSSADAQQPGKVSRIGYLSNTDAATDSARAKGIRQALRELGYIEGKNIATEYRYAEGKSDRLPGLASELVRLNVDIIVAAGGTLTVRAVMNATKTLPITHGGRWGRSC